MVEQGPYRFLPGETFHRDDLIAVAAANGYRLSPEMLSKLRVWRLLPGPTAGGKTGKGPGKGQRWPAEAARRVAWIARWRGLGLSFDTLRLALWPWTPELDGKPLADVLSSLRRFVAEDERLHQKGYGLPRDREEYRIPERYPDGSDNRAYIELVNYGDTDTDRTRRAIRGSDPDLSGREIESLIPFVGTLSIPALHSAFTNITVETLRHFIPTFRQKSPDDRDFLTLAFLHNPLDLVRLIVRQLYRFSIGGADVPQVRRACEGERLT
jgi:hypothetical protein